MKPPSSPLSRDILNHAHRSISQFDLAILLFNLWRGLKDVGWNHASITVDTFAKKFNRPVKIRDTDLESLMYMGNMLDESGEFWHPQNLKWEEFAKHLVNAKGQSFDRNYNYIKGVKRDD